MTPKNAANMRTHYVLIDYENVQVKSLALLFDTTSEQFQVRVFLGKTNTKLGRDLVIAMHALGSRAAYVALDSSGPNALDFHIAFYLGELVAIDSSAFFHIISKDKGFDPLVAHLKSRNVLAARSASIETMPCFVKLPAAKASPAKAIEKPTPQVMPKATPNVVPKANPKATAKTAVKAATKPASKPAPPPKAQAKTASTPEREQQIKLVIDNLAGRTTGKPASLKTLRSTIHARIGKTLPEADAQAVLDALIERKLVVVNGNKLVYDLPSAS
jgi:outer membrane biosynthesis protein TonB